MYEVGIYYVDGRYETVWIAAASPGHALRQVGQRWEHVKSVKGLTIVSAPNRREEP